MYKWKVDESLTNQVAEMLPYNNAFDVWKTDPLEEILIQKIQSYQEAQILNEILSQAMSIISFIRQYCFLSGFSFQHANHISQVVCWYVRTKAKVLGTLEGKFSGWRGEQVATSGMD